MRPAADRIPLMNAPGSTEIPPKAAERPGSLRRRLRRGMLFTGVALVAVYAYMLATAGGALVQHKTKNPYLHLAAGCALFMLISAIPYLGGFVTFAVVVICMGAVVATRGAGFLAGKNRRDSGPYRTATP